MKRKNPIIVALDVDNIEQAMELVYSLKDYVEIFKIGPVLFLKYGPEIVFQLKEMGCRVFLDMKLHDIPNAVGLSVKSAAKLGADMLTLHISGGKHMIKTAVKEAEKTSVLLIGVTILTSLKKEDLKMMYKERPLTALVLEYCSVAAECGLKGVVVSPREVRSVRGQFPSLKIVVPGIRPSWYESNDQKRIGTPKQVIQDGADYLVIGRPIIRTKDPVENLKRILEEVL